MLFHIYFWGKGGCESYLCKTQDSDGTIIEGKEESVERVTL